MSEKQAQYRADLITRVLASVRDVTSPTTCQPGADRETWHLTTASPRTTRAAALALALPAPADSADASDQIGALATDGAGLTDYARNHRDWARPVIDALVAAWGRDASRRPPTITVADLRALASA